MPDQPPQQPPRPPRGRTLKDALDQLQGIMPSPVAPAHTIEQSVATVVAARAANDVEHTPAAPAPTPAAPASARKSVPVSQAEIEREIAGEEVRQLVAERDRLEADLDASRRLAEATRASLGAAEDLWQRSEVHTRADGERLAQLREQAIATTASIQGIEQQIKETARAIATRQSDDEQKRMREQLAAEWPPLVNELAAAVRHLLRLLARQQRVREENSAAWGLARVDTLSLSDSRGDNTVGWLNQWLLEAQRSGYLTPATLATDATPAPAKADPISPAVRALVAEVAAAKAQVAATLTAASTHTNP